MKIIQSINTVEKSDEFMRFKEKNPDFYLASVFSLNNKDWVVGYYSIKKDRMVTFNVNPVKQNPPDEVFKEEKRVDKLEMKQVKLSLKEADEICEDLKKTKYSSHNISQKIIILQNHDALIYNMTLITTTFNVINIKIDAISGKVLSETITSALSFRQ